MRRKRSLPETSIETTSRWPRNRHESSGPTTVPADFVERLAMGGRSGCRVLGATRQRYPEPPSSNDGLIFDPFRGRGHATFRLWRNRALGQPLPSFSSLL
jgi:hypothetical protein